MQTSVMFYRSSHFQQDFDGDSLITYLGTTGDDTYSFNTEIEQIASIIAEAVDGGIDTLTFTGKTAISIDLTNLQPQIVHPHLVLTVANLENVTGGKCYPVRLGHAQKPIRTYYI